METPDADEDSPLLKTPLRYPFPVKAGEPVRSQCNPLRTVGASVAGHFPGSEGVPKPVEDIEQLRAKVRKLEAQVEELEGLAHRDCLLGIPNRRRFFQSLGTAISEANHDAPSSAVLFVDVNRLKEINDTYGHRMGDEALLAVMRLMVDMVPGDGCVARLGGDEFGILLKDTTEEGAFKVASSICATVNGSTLTQDGSRVPLGISIGRAMIHPGDDPKAVVERADKDMYQMKNQVSSVREPSAE
jgi:diguanylate cyclase (GGDEF)-like protein